MIFFNKKSQETMVKELKTLLKQNKNNISMIFFSKQLKETCEKAMKNNNLQSIIKLIISANNYTPVNLNNTVAYVLEDGKPQKVKYVFNNKTKILSCNIDNNKINVDLKDIGEYLCDLKNTKNISLFKRKLNEVIKNIKTL